MSVYPSFVLLDDIIKNKNRTWDQFNFIISRHTIVAMYTIIAPVPLVGDCFEVTLNIMTDNNVNMNSEQNFFYSCTLCKLLNEKEESERGGKNYYYLLLLFINNKKNNNDNIHNNTTTNTN